MTSISLLHALECHSPDTFKEILLHYIHPIDCAALSCTSKGLYSLLQNDSIWEYYCKYSIKGLYKSMNSKQIILLKDLLEVESFQMMYILMRKLEFSFFGWYRLNHSGQHPLLNGGLYCIRIVNNKVLCQQINYHGDIVLGNDSYIIKYDPYKKCLIATSILIPMEYVIDMDVALRMHIRGGYHFQQQQQQQQQQPYKNHTQQMTIQYYTTQQVGFKSGDIIDFIVMKPLPFALNFNQVPYSLRQYSDYRNCVGLFTAPYGSHGIEILHLSLYPSTGNNGMNSLPNTTISFNASKNELFQYLEQFNNYITTTSALSNIHPSLINGFELRALKVTGDPNVPAGKLSFIVNLTNFMNIDNEMENDQRFIVIFPSDSSIPTLMNFNERKSNIALWARGYGQVNRIPNEWKPEWVGCSFIMYKKPLNYTGATFSLIWDDDTDPYFRHAMDFEPMKQGNAPCYSQNNSELFPCI